jgi:hypothetical protein
MWAMEHEFPETGSKIFFGGGLDTRLSVEPVHEIRFFAQAFFADLRGASAAIRAKKSRQESLVGQISSHSRSRAMT